MKIGINEVFSYIQNKVSSMEFLEIVTCYSIQLGARFAFSVFEGKQAFDTAAV